MISNTVVVSQDPRGRYFEGVLAAAAKPGTCVKISATDLGGGASDTFLSGGVVRTRTVTPGFAGLNLVVCEMGLLGKTDVDEYPISSGVHVYSPLPGDELNLLVLSGETVNVGDRLIFNAAGKLIVSVTGPYVAQETLGLLAADGFCLVMFGGSNAATV